MWPLPTASYAALPQRVLQLFLQQVMWLSHMATYMSHYRLHDFPVEKYAASLIASYTALPTASYVAQPILMP